MITDDGDVPFGQRRGRISESRPAGSSSAALSCRSRSASYAPIQSPPDYPGSGRGIFFTSLNDIAFVIVCAVVSTILIGSPFFIAWVFVFGG